MHRLFLALVISLEAAILSHAQISHRALVRGWDAESFERGKQLYQTICVTCHGTPESPGTLPTSRAFWKEPFKNGHDPLSIFKTIRDGFGQMPAWPGLDARSTYDVIHFVREEFLQKQNPSAYFEITADYLSGLPKDAIREPDAAERTPPYLRMNFGPSLNWTIEAEPGNIAYKGIAVRLDPGPGGVSKGHAWMLYDHDTMRVAAAWTGSEFVDWKGIAFDGSHQTHTSIVGEKAFVNPVGPGWADPKSGSFDDPRFRGRDAKPYGPLRRDWTHFKGLYRHEGKTLISYSVGQAEILELPQFSQGAFSRTLNIGARPHDLLLRIAPDNKPVILIGGAHLEKQGGFWMARIARGSPVRIRVSIGASNDPGGQPADLSAFTKGGLAQWAYPLAASARLGDESAPFAVDAISLPEGGQNPWQSWMRLGGFDFFSDGRRAAVCTWLGEVWLVSGLEGSLQNVSWTRIAAGLFQPLGLKIVEDTIYVACRDQIVRLHDLNGDGEMDFYENFNNDHQVTEHFHEFAMGLQTDSTGNFYYAKSARHALPALVPHHGTLLRVSKDGSRTDILATGFRAANGVCVNDDGTFFVTDQEGHWTPKNRINWVHPGRFYGNFMAYHDRTSSADSDMEQPLVWITNEMDRSPGEIVRVTSAKWGSLDGALLNLSYGTGRIYLVSHETINGQMQGGVAPLPIPDLPTGVMRGRFHPGSGHLYACGLFAWAGNRTADGGFYRVRKTGLPAHLPVAIEARPRGLLLRFSDPLDKTEAQKPENFALKSWSLKRSADYGSKHYNITPLRIERASVSADGQTIELTVPDLRPAWCLETKYSLRGAHGEAVTNRIHHTIHSLPSAD